METNKKKTNFTDLTSYVLHSGIHYGHLDADIRQDGFGGSFFVYAASCIKYLIFTEFANSRHPCPPWREGHPFLSFFRFLVFNEGSRCNFHIVFIICSVMEMLENNTPKLDMTKEL